jgi:tubulin--tyrosine ligase-like protein 12
MKNNLTDLIQDEIGLNSYFNLSYNMNTSLAEIIGNFLHNEKFNCDNSWILKPTNMARSMDMTVTNNLDEIIRNVETGPKICQKYLERPLLLNNRKFDLRFIIVLKSLVPLEVYFYSKMFWVRSANKNFSMDSATFTDYEVHFTVMNYNTYGMQTVYDKQFLEFLEEQGISWTPIYEKIKSAVKDVFLMAGRSCPQMSDPFSRAIYGLDIMIDSSLNPKILEINYSPDCTRACQFIPEFFNDIFSTLFLNKSSGVELI